MNKSALLAAYLRQQKELSLPDPILGPLFDVKQFMARLSPPAVPVRSAVQTSGAKNSAAYANIVPIKAGAPRKSNAMSAADRLSKLPRLPSAGYGAPVPQVVPASAGTHLRFDEKRAVFKEMYIAQCSACPLAATRHSFVFGAGNVDAPLMIVGEAPGAEEDAQGLPFIGAAGQLLTTLLSAIGLDRKKDTFITNILKCRPPANRTPESAEIAVCLPLLYRQIDTMAPRLLLLLGRIAAHALLDKPDSIIKLRGPIHSFRGIPALVTYHPAAILRNPEYQGPAEEDFRRAAQLLKESGNDGASR
jgi:uracil-DNA glycosylase family 4